MSGRLTDEQVARYVDMGNHPATSCANDDAIALAREVQEYRTLRPDCPTCDGQGVEFASDEDDIGDACDDCTDGKVPLDKWVALLVQTLAPLPASLADIALTIPSCSHSDPQEGDCDWLLRAHVRRIEAVLKMAEAAR